MHDMDNHIVGDLIYSPAFGYGIITALYGKDVYHVEWDTGYSTDNGDNEIKMWKNYLDFKIKLNRFY